MTTLDSGFEDAAREGLLDVIERRCDRTVGPRLAGDIKDRIAAYGNRHDYDVRAIVQATRYRVERTSQSVRIVVELPDPAYLFETGTADHVVEADQADVLSFIWERRHDPPQWVRDQYEREGDGWRVFLPKVEVTGLPEGRFLRDSLNSFRRRLS